MGRMGAEQPQYIGQKRSTRARRTQLRDRRTRRRADGLKHRPKSTERVSRKTHPGVFRQRRAIAAALLLIPLALILAGLTWNSGSERTAPIAASKAGPGTTLARVGGIDISTPVRPSDLTGLGYHPDGEGLLPLKPRGENASSIWHVLPGGSTPEETRYYSMDAAGRDGPRTGALDVGAKAGDEVYAPVDGMITAIRPDPLVEGSNVIEIQSTGNPDLRVYVSGVEKISSGTGVETTVKAGKTQLGTVADSASVLNTQLSNYTGGAGNHVTVSAVSVN